MLTNGTRETDIAEQYTNAFQTTLASSASSGATSISVAATTGFPPPVYRLTLDPGTASAEIVEVTAAAGTTLTVTRAAEPINGAQTAFTHAQGAVVINTLTAASLTAIVNALAAAQVTDAAIVSALGYVPAQPPVAVSQGGTGQTTYTDGQLLIGNSSTGGLNQTTLTAGSGVTITNGHGTITIASSGGGGGGGGVSIGGTISNAGVAGGILYDSGPGTLEESAQFRYQGNGALALGQKGSRGGFLQLEGSSSSGAHITATSSVSSMQIVGNQVGVSSRYGGALYCTSGGVSIVGSATIYNGSSSGNVYVYQSIAGTSLTIVSLICDALKGTVNVTGLPFAYIPNVLNPTSVTTSNMTVSSITLSTGSTASGTIILIGT